MTKDSRLSSAPAVAGGIAAGNAVRNTPRVKSRWQRLFNARDLNTNLNLLLMALPGVILLFVFAYLPMFGLMIAFKDYRFNLGIFGSEWVGLENFRFLFGTDAAWRITRNTILMNLIFITINTSTSLVVAILLNEVFRSRMVKYYQTLLFFPYFISWVVASYFVFGLLNGNTGLVNQVFASVGLDPVVWYRAPQYWPVILALAHLWNGLGFGSIIYLAGILGISPELYEAAKIDGAGRWAQLRFITLPMLAPLIIILTLLAIGKIFNADFGLFYFLPRDTPMLYSTTDVIDTFVYRSLVELGNISMAAAAGFYQSVVGFVLVILANWAVRRYNEDYSLF
ncbi:MAG: sugar ABC transporter permease [Caldilineaceae bacterium]|nr:sugar ABC transporter permease [Caldilineaceae bacterium]